MLKHLAAAAGLALLSCSPALALPAAPTDALSAASASGIVLVKHDSKGSHHGHVGRRPNNRPHFTPGRRYGSAPHGWHRYGARPGNWRTRGCILVGPVWFCP